MDNLFSSSPVLVSFRQIYEQNIASRLKEIDIFLKSTTSPYSIQHIAKLLDMPTEEILDIMSLHHIEHVHKIEFFTIVSCSSSYICRLIKRQWKYVNVPFYTAPMIADIYELNENKVIDAFNSLGKEYIYESEIMQLFEFIYTPIFRV